MSYVIGIDGGASKTHAVVSDHGGVVLGEGTAGPANLHTVEAPEIKRNIIQAVEQAKKEAGVEGEPGAVCLGVAGLDAPSDQVRADALLKEVFADVSHRVALNDTVIARRSNSKLPYGFAIIAGTGSNAFAINAAGEQAFAGGLGHLLADEGSAYAFGLSALRAAVRADDGREDSVLGTLVKKKLGVASMREAVPIVYASDFSKSDIAAFAPLVDRAAEKNDEVARSIIEQGADELTQMVVALARKLEMTEVVCDLVMIGSQINNSPLLKQKFTRSVQTHLPTISFVENTNDAVVGAVRIATDLIS